jgi:ABC-2 type transport system ATP-binding protein
VAGAELRLTDASTLELVLEKSRSINEVFSALTALGIEVVSMRNKANRLEELFVRMVEKNLDTPSTGATP